MSLPSEEAIRAQVAVDMVKGKDFPVARATIKDEGRVEQTRRIVEALREQATEFAEVEKHPATRWADFIEREFGV